MPQILINSLSYIKSKAYILHQHISPQIIQPMDK